MKTLTLDLSTSATGFALFDDHKLTEYGALAPKIKGIHKQRYPLSSLRKIIAMTLAVSEKVKEFKPDKIYIEEVNRGIQRKSQKGLDGLHFYIYLCLITLVGNDKIYYIDSDGKTGWRKILNLRLSDEDKKHNRKCTRKNKLPKITKKHLAERYVNSALDLSLDVNANTTDADIADAIGIGLALIKAKHI